MKKFNVGIIFALCLGLLAGCSNSTSPTVKEPTKTSNEDAIKVVTTIFPVYDWVKSVGGNKVDVTYLVNEGTDLHNFQPSAKDILTISDADLFVYVGGESDEWVEETVESSENNNLKTINLLEELSDIVKEEEMVEGMEVEEEHGEGEEMEEMEYDEHIWLSLINADKSCSLIKDALSEISPENKSYFEDNYTICKNNFDSLNKEFMSVVNNANVDTVVFADRFPFRYLADDYNLNYYAAFAGCSAETEASFETISFLAEKVDELNLNYIYNIEGTNSKIAQTVVDTSSNKPEILTLDSMQSVTQSQADNGASYVKIMENNLEILKKGLSNE